MITGDELALELVIFPVGLAGGAIAGEEEEAAAAVETCPSCYDATCHF